MDSVLNLKGDGNRRYGLWGDSALMNAVSALTKEAPQRFLTLPTMGQHRKRVLSMNISIYDMGAYLSMKGEGSHQNTNHAGTSISNFQSTKL